MYTLNFTRFIGLIFIGSGLILRAKSTTLTELPKCDSATEASDTVCKDLTSKTYCIDNKNIFLSDPGDTSTSVSASCKTESSTGYKIFKCGESACDKIIESTGIGSGDSIVYKDGEKVTGKYFDNSNKRLINCPANSACEVVATDGYYFVDNTVVEVKVTATSKDAKVPTITKAGTYYFLDEENKTSETYTKLIKCTKGDSSLTCSSESSPTAGVYVNGGKTTVTDAVIICSGESVTCKAGGAANSYYANAGLDKATKPLITCDGSGCSAGDLPAEGTYYYLDQGSEESGTIKKYLLCKKTSKKSTCTSTDAPTDAVILLNSATASGLTKALIKCESGSCVPETPSVTTGSIYYLNGDSTNKFLIKCTSGGCGPESSVKAGFYINAIPASAKFTNALIKCESSPAACNVVSLDATNRLNSIFIDNGTGKLIQCIDNSNGCKAFAGTGTATEAAYYINGEKSGAIETPSERKRAEAATSYKDLLIKCTTTCGPADAAEYNVYLNGNFKDTTKNPNGDDKNQLISCTDGACTAKENKVSTGSEFYVNAGAINKKTQALIKCTKDTAVTCGSEPVADDVIENFYINANTDDVVHYVIRCTSEGCEAVTTTNANAKAADVENYINGAGSGLKDAVIQCTLKEHTESARKRTESTTKKFEATCTPVARATANNIYINYDLQHIIRCTGTGCTAVNNDSGDTKSAYYINTKNSSTTLIKCTTEGCIEVTEFESETVIYLNSNYKEGADTQNPLIKCNSPSSGAKRTTSRLTCELAAPSTTKEDEPEFYINSDRDKNNKDYDGFLKTDIIKCTAKATAASRKRETATYTYECKTQTASANDIYFNGNFDKSSKEIIKCTADKGCVEAAAYKEGVTGLIYYVNAGHAKEKPLEDTLIKCTASGNPKCTPLKAKHGEIYINALDSQLILCSDDANGCVAKTTKANTENNEFYLNSSDINNNEDANTNDLIKCSLDTTKNEKTCIPFTAKVNGVYVNAFNTTEVIQCLKDVECKIKASQATATRPEYYVNGDDIDFKSETKKRDDVDKDPLNGDLIECKVNSSNVIRCAVTNGKNGDIYINSNYSKEKGEGGARLGEEENQLIQCTTDKGCITIKVDPTAEKPFYYVNSGNKATPKFKDALIKCTYKDAACEIIKTKANEVYANSNDQEKSQKPLIKCGKVSCATAVSAATKENKEYYLNAGKVSEQPLTYDIIKCSVKSTGSGENATESTVCKLLKKEELNIESGVGIYLNSNYAEFGDNKQLIQCTEENGCVGIKAESTAKIMEYYVNAESSDSLDNALIYCSNNRCEKQTPESVPMYFVGKDTKNDVDGLIECKEVEKTTPEPETPTAKRRNTVTKCAIKSAFTSQGYYLNSGQNKATNQVILCDSSDGCASLKVDLGYYVNAGNEEKKIIKCEREGAECSEIQSPECPSDEEIVAGSYCYEGDTLKFYPSNDSTAITASKSDDSYAFATIQANIFPGIRQETSALFKISRYFINRYFQSGVISIDKNGKLVDSLDGDQSDITLYDCNDSSKTCNEKQGCTSDTYMFDAENKKALFCNDGKLEYAQFTGYVLDSNRVTTGSKHPYIIHCKNNGKKCESIKPKTSIDTYYENNGYDATTNALIQCGSNNCRTVTASAGYYVGHGEDGYSGIIKCTSTNSCTYSQVKSKVKYVNAGENKNTYAIIDCNKVNGCNVAKANIGYYLTHTSTLLIQCTSPTTCTEFTPTVNYFDNADSSESSNTIINCVQNSSIVTCSAEAANNGYYLTSSSNILISCKTSGKCKSITLTNGIFRSALKGLTSSNNNSNNSNNNSNNNARDVEERAVDAMEDNLEEDGKSVMMRDSDEAYGIIRCVSGKCEALSANEVAAIPICEFNNNKCYITLEYSMTKSATTSITAGNICTNGDRSIFYFATDTIVVKPNVISGVTATYIYTTTNSNCLEVNDSYNDMYFTVGSNIYTLDQGSVLQFYNTGYYFINVDKNTLVKGNDIDAYNDDNVKLYRCNGSACSIVDKPESVTYYADVNKRILKYNVNNDAYTFAYEKDITCIFNNNKCTPNSDMKSHEFCITYKGEIVLARNDIKNRETGECFRSNSMNVNIYGYSQYLYVMNEYAAQMVDQTGYYIVSLSTNTTVVSKNYKTKNSNIIVYGCNISSCKIYEPDENTYYYDEKAKNILRYKNGVWKVPSTSGYAYVSIDPTNTYVYKFTKKDEEITIQNKANYGYYYTVDDEMFLCEEGSCAPITETGYFFTNVGEVYYCVHDSEGLEVTECTRQYCVSGQYYSINDAYYRCENSSILTPVVSRYCSYDDNVIINYPLAFNEELPDKIKQAVNGIETINNSTAIITYRKNFLESVSGIFTNCTYNVEDTKSTFDLVCINNYVSVDKESNKVKICSIEQLGYVECVEDETNPEKCKVSAAYIMKPSIFVTLIVLFFAMLYHLY